jgi:thioredoxin 1
MAGHHTVEVTDETFDSTVLKSEVPVLVDFWAPWCGPCVSIAPTLEEIAKDYQGKVAVCKVNVDENRHVPSNYGVRSIPYLVLFHRGQVVDTVIGAVPKGKLVAMIDKAMN